MNTSNEGFPTAVFREGRIFVAFPSGVEFSFPITGNWRLEGATVAQLENMEIDDEGIHWPELDEDLCFEGLLKGDYGQYVRSSRSA